jgi:hypothetical protein
MTGGRLRQPDFAGRAADVHFREERIQDDEEVQIFDRFTMCICKISSIDWTNQPLLRRLLLCASSRNARFAGW